MGIFSNILLCSFVEFVSNNFTIILGLFWLKKESGGGENSKKSLCQFCVNLIDFSWHLVTKLATSVTISLIKIMVNKLKKD